MSLLTQRTNLGGRRAVIVGGAAGIGEAITLALAEAGVDVAFCDIRGGALAATRDRIAQMGRTVVACEADAVAPEQLSAFYAEVAQSFGSIDILVNTVGGTLRGWFADSDPERWQDDIARNYVYVLHSIRHALPLMRESEHGGSIVNFTTIEAHRGAPMFAVYAGAKAALTNFTRSLAAELGRDGIRVNMIAPEHTASAGGRAPLGEDVIESLSRLPASVREDVLHLRTPTKRAVTAEDIAALTLFLVSDLSIGLTGQTLHADGGSSACMGFLDWPYGDGFHPVPLAGSIAHLFGVEPQ